MKQADKLQARLNRRALRSMSPAKAAEFNQDIGRNTYATQGGLMDKAVGDQYYTDMRQAGIDRQNRSGVSQNTITPTVPVATPGLVGQPNTAETTKTPLVPPISPLSAEAPLATIADASLDPANKGLLERRIAFDQALQKEPTKIQDVAKIAEEAKALQIDQGALSNRLAAIQEQKRRKDTINPNARRL